MMRAQAVVVGAGPAGSVTALLLSRAGFDVIIVDRRSFPRAKACGDCLSAGATHVLRRLDLLDPIGALPGAWLRGWRIVSPDGGSFEARFGDDCAAGDEAALAVERRVLDAALLAAAVGAGARFLPGCAVTDLVRSGRRVLGVRTRAGTILADLTVGADGLRSIVAARLGVVRRQARLRKVSLTAHLPAHLAERDVGEMHVADGLCVGMAAISRSDELCNVTVVADAAAHGRSIARDSRAFFASALSLTGVRDRIDDNALGNARFLGSGPFDRPVRRVVFDGAALVGDAAGYYDPFTGQGVFQAMAGAEALAPVAARALGRSACTAAALRPYAAAHARLLRGSRIVQRGIEHVLAHPPLANRAIDRLARSREFARTVIRVTGDLTPAASLLSRSALFSLIRPTSRPGAAP